MVFCWHSISINQAYENLFPWLYIFKVKYMESILKLVTDSFSILNIPKKVCICMKCKAKKEPSTPTNWSNKFSSHFEWELCSNPYRCFYILCVRYEFLTGMPSRWEIEHDYLCLFGLNLLLWLLALLFMGILIVANKNLEFCFRLCIHLFNLNVPINYFAVEWFFWMVLVVVRLLPLLVVASVRTHTV